MSDKLRKLLLAIETAVTPDQLNRFPGWKLHPLKGELRVLELDGYGKLAVDFPLRRNDKYGQRC
jgi:hypothetical protein